MARPSFNETFLEIAGVVAKRSTCPRLAVGAVLAKDNRIIATGYNGSPPGLPHCLEVGCLQAACTKCINGYWFNLDARASEICTTCHGSGFTGGCKRAVHAEANAILQCAKIGTASAGAILFCTHEPCIDCSKLIISAGILEVYFQAPYNGEHSSEAAKMLREAGLNVYAIPAK